MLRGALGGAAWATALCLASLAAVRALGIRPHPAGYLSEFVHFFGQDLGGIPFFVSAGAIGGTLVGLLGRLAEAPPPWLRRLLLWFVFFPAVAVGMAVVIWTAGFFAAGPEGPIVALLGLPKAILMTLAFGLPWFMPGLALPLLGAAWSVEAWTRPPPELPPT